MRLSDRKTLVWKEKEVKLRYKEERPTYHFFLS